MSFDGRFGRVAWRVLALHGAAEEPAYGGSFAVCVGGRDRYLQRGGGVAFRHGVGALGSARDVGAVFVFGVAALPLV